MLYLFALLAQWDNENRARETSKGKQQRAKEGYWNGTLSFGYVTPRQLKRISGYWENSLKRDRWMKIPIPQGRQHRELSRPVARSHRRGCDSSSEKCNRGVAGLHLLLSRQSVRRGCGGRPQRSRISHHGNWGERLFEADTVRPMLQNRFYLGEAQYKGQWMPGRHPAIIPQALFDKCQEVRAMRRGRTVRGTSKKRVYPLSRLALCAHCGQPMRGQANHSEERYYRDPRRSSFTCDQRMVRAEDAEQAIVRYLASIQAAGRLARACLTPQPTG